MRRVLLLVTVLGCHNNKNGGPDGPGGGMATGMAQMLNGASPRAAALAFAPAASSSGNWQITPSKLRLPITGLSFVGMGGTTYVDVTVTSCAIAFDILKPGLAQSVACPFTLAAGTYIGAGVTYDTTFDILIDDATNGFFTDPTSASKLSATVPAGGAQFVTFPNPRGGIPNITTPFPTPLTVAAGDQVTVSALFNALQTFQINVNNGQLAFGADANGVPGFGDSVTAVGTPAAIGYYVNPMLATPFSFNGSTVGPTHPFSVGVLYGNNAAPASLGMTTGNMTPGCGPIQIGGIFPGKSYLGLDANGVLGWTSFSDTAGTMYSVELAMPQVATLGATTTLECLDITTDPMPPGGSFSSGAPAIPSPTYATTMTLVAN